MLPLPFEIGPTLIRRQPQTSGGPFTPQLFYRSLVIWTVECVMSIDALAMAITHRWMAESRQQIWIL